MRSPSSPWPPAFKATQDQAEFLPDHYESIKAYNLQDEAFGSTSQVAAIVVFDRKDGGQLTADDQAEVEQVVDGLGGGLKKAFTGIEAQPPSENGLVQLAVVGLSDDVTGYDTASFDAVKALRADLEKAVTGDLEYGVTGTVAQGYDQQESGNKALLIVGVATALLILVLLAIIFRSVLICLLPLLTVGFVLTPISTGLIATANKLFDLKASRTSRPSWSSSCSASAPTTSCSSSSATASGCARARRSAQRSPTRSSGPVRRSRPPAVR